MQTTFVNLTLSKIEFTHSKANLHFWDEKFEKLKSHIVKKNSTSYFLAKFIASMFAHTE